MMLLKTTLQRLICTLLECAVNALSLVKQKSMRAFNEILLSLMCSCCGTFSIHSFYFLRHNNHVNILAKLSLMVTQRQQYSKAVHMEMVYCIEQFVWNSLWDLSQRSLWIAKAYRGMNILKWWIWWVGGHAIDASWHDANGDNTARGHHSGYLWYRSYVVCILLWWWEWTLFSICDVDLILILTFDKMCKDVRSQKMCHFLPESSSKRHRLKAEQMYMRPTVIKDTVTQSVDSTLNRRTRRWSSPSQQDTHYVRSILQIS